MMAKAVAPAEAAAVPALAVAAVLAVATTNYFGK